MWLYLDLIGLEIDIQKGECLPNVEKVIMKLVLNVNVSVNVMVMALHLMIPFGNYMTLKTEIVIEQSTLDDAWTQAQFVHVMVNKFLTGEPVGTRLRIKGAVVKLKLPGEKKWKKVYPVKY